MASVSYGLNRGADQSPNEITVGTLAVTTNNVELRWDATVGLERQDIILICQAFIRRLEDSSNGDVNNV